MVYVATISALALLALFSFAFALWTYANRRRHLAEAQRELSMRVGNDGGERRREKLTDNEMEECGIEREHSASAQRIFLH